MSKQFWINLPVSDMARSKQFFTDIGFRVNPLHENNPEIGSFFLDESDTVMMLFSRESMEGFMANTITDTSVGNEILLNIDAESREEVDAMAERVKNAGGTIYAEPGESDGWMYAFGFVDPDGHRWSMLYMDMSKAPGQEQG